jgi:hypothetical protein
MTSRTALFAVGAALLAGACAPEGGRVVGEGTLVADQTVYPDPAGPLVGGIARTDEEAEALWAAIGFSGEPPRLDGSALVAVSGGELGDCPWELADVTTSPGEVTLVLADPQTDPFCSDDRWHPRALAATVPNVGDHAGVGVIHPWGEREVVTPIADRTDPQRWERRTWTTDDVGLVGGCGGASGRASETASAPGSAKPIADRPLEIRQGLGA